MTSSTGTGWWVRLRGDAVLLLVTVAVPLCAVAGVVVYDRYGQRPWMPPELSGDAEAIRLLSADEPRGYLPALGVELVLIGGFVVASIAAGLLGRARLLTKPGRGVAGAAVGAGVLAGIAALVAKGFVAYAAWRPDAVSWLGVDECAVWAQGFAFAMAALLAFSVTVAVAVVSTVLVRSVHRVRARRRRIPEIDLEPGVAESKVGHGHGGAAAWAANWRRPSTRRDVRVKVGVCVSGGGIRSAAFSLGALQVLQETNELANARYLVAVSGGGYAAGAMRLALGPHLSTEGSPVPVPSTKESLSTVDVFANGSPEFDYVRRHSKYLAEGAGQWLLGLGVVLRGFVVAQMMLLCTVILAGRGIGEIYKAIPALAEPFPRDGDLMAVGSLLSHPRLPPASIVGAIGGTFTVAVLAWLIGLAMENWGARRTRKWSARARKCGKSFALLGLGMVVLAVLIPLLVLLSGELLRLLREGRPHYAGPQTTAAGAATVAAAGYVAAVAGIFLTVGRLARPAVGWVWSHRARLRALPAVFLQWLLVVIGVAVLVSAHVFVFARVVADTMGSGSRLPDDWPGALQNWHFLLLLGILLILGVLVDQTRWRLHPFYKQRLMTAFAVRRARDGTGDEPYKFDEEATPLSRYCSYVPGFPQVILLAAANVSGQDLTPPGRRALPYTLSGDWIGSPQLGWIRSERLEKLASYPLRMDLTTQAAMAVSGAAFASAMGASAAPFSLLFTLTNARLGTWLPNPRFLYRHRQHAPAGQLLPSLPSWRRLPYLIREIFGIYPGDSRMLLVTDGGHYENLGVVELLRHQPEVAYCFDASGGEDLTASALGPAIMLAHHELGVKITFDRPPTAGACHQPDCLTPGSAADTQTPARLAGRLAKSAVLVATIEYPDCRPLDTPKTGTLYFGRAILTPESPWPVLAYASGHPSFPNDRTSDQWFDHAQFDAYHALGRHVGCATVTAAGVACPPPAQPAAPDASPPAQRNHDEDLPLARVDQG